MTLLYAKGVMDQSVLKRIATRVAESEVTPQVMSEDTLTLKGPFKPYRPGDETEIERDDLTVVSPGSEFINDEDGYHLFYIDCEFDIEPAERATRDYPGYSGSIELTNYQVVAIDGFILLNPEDRVAAKEKLDLSDHQIHKLEEKYGEDAADRAADDFYEP
jgi:hypothetical protein